MMASQLPKFSEVIATVHRSGVLELRLNTPENLNTFTPRKFRDLVAGLDFAKSQKDVNAVVVTANGRIFSSGAAVQGENRLAADSDCLKAAREYIESLIDFPKLLATGIHGSAIGIATTMLPFFDLIYATPSASLTTPFSRIGISAEACSTVTFPPIFGPSMTTRLLYLSQTVPVTELEYTGLFREILPNNEYFQDLVVQKVQEQLDGLAPGSILASKGLVRSAEVRAKLHAVNDAEMEVVNNRLKSPEHFEALERFFEAEKARKRKSKL